MVALQPVSARAFVETGAKNAGVDQQAAAEEFDETIHYLTGFYIDELSPAPFASNVKLPTLVVQVRQDAMTHPNDVQEIYDKLSSKKKELLQIEGTTRRFNGYNFFGENPERMLSWFKEHMQWLASGFHSFGSVV